MQSTLSITEVYCSVRTGHVKRHSVMYSVVCTGTIFYVNQHEGGMIDLYGAEYGDVDIDTGTNLQA